MCADVVMLIRDVATRDMVEDKLFWDVSKEGGRGRCIKFPGLPSTTPPLIEGDRLCPSGELADAAGFSFSSSLENVVRHFSLFGVVVDRACLSERNKSNVENKLV